LSENLVNMFHRYIEDLDTSGLYRIARIFEEVSDAGGGYRLAGTEGEERAALYIGDRLLEYGFKVQLQEVPIDRWIRKRGVLRFEDGYEVDLYPYPGQTSAEVEGVFTTKTWEKDLRGRIVFTEDVYRWPSHIIPIEEYAVRGAGAAVILKAGLPNNLYFIADSEGGASIPFATVRASTKRELLEREGLKCEFILEVEVDEGVGFNVIGYIGEGYEAIISAHHDAYYPGIVDNAIGVSLALDIASKLAVEKPRNRRVVFISFTAEEYGRIDTLYDYLWGSTYFFRGRDNSRTLFLFNIDVVGLRGEAHSLIYTPDTRQIILPVLEAVSRELRYGVKLSSRPSLWLDMWSAVASGISSISLSQIGDNEYHRLYYHTEGDTIDLVDEYLYREAYALSTLILRRGLASSIPFRISEVVREVRRSWRRGFMRELGEEKLYSRMLSAEEWLRRIENSPLTGEKTHPSLAKLLALFRRRLFKTLYIYGSDYPTNLYVEYRGEYLREVLETLKDIAYLREKGVEDIRDKLSKTGLLSWALDVSRETVDRLLTRYVRNVYWDEDYLPPYIRVDKAVFGEEDVGELIKEVYGYIELKLSELSKLIDDIEEVVKGFEEEARQ